MKEIKALIRQHRIADAIQALKISATAVRANRPQSWRVPELWGATSFRKGRFGGSTVARTRFAMRGGDEFVQDAAVGGDMPSLAMCT